MKSFGNSDILFQKFGAFIFCSMFSQVEQFPKVFCKQSWHKVAQIPLTENTDTISTPELYSKCLVSAREIRLIWKMVHEDSFFHIIVAIILSMSCNIGDPYKNDSVFWNVTKSVLIFQIVQVVLRKKKGVWLRIFTIHLHSTILLYKANYELQHFLNTTYPVAGTRPFAMTGNQTTFNFFILCNRHSCSVFLC